MVGGASGSDLRDRPRLTSVHANATGTHCQRKAPRRAPWKVRDGAGGRQGDGLRPLYLIRARSSQFLEATTAANSRIHSTQHYGSQLWIRGFEPFPDALRTSPPLSEPKNSSGHLTLRVGAAGGGGHEPWTRSANECWPTARLTRVKERCVEVAESDRGQRKYQSVNPTWELFAVPEKKTAAELEQMILKEVSNLPACQGLQWIAIRSVQTTWQVDMYGGDPARQAECMDAINSVTYRLRSLYDLAPHEAA